MKKSLIVFVLILTFFIFPKKTVLAGLKINEIYPAPQTGESEWVELYNDENKSIDLSKYSLTDAVETQIKINDSVIEPLGFIIAVSSNVLNNNGDTVFLKNNLGEIIESVTYTGSFNYEKSFVKCPDGSGVWFALNIITKNISNQNACSTLTPPPTATTTPTPPAVPTATPTITTPPTPTPTNPATTSTPTPTPTPVSYNNIYLSEFMAYPETDQNEWVELYNANNFTVYLASWYIDDIENAGSAPKIFSKEIPALGYAVFELSSSVFNNDEDSVRLLDFNSALKDGFSYKDAVKGKTFGRVFPANNFCLQQPSKGTANTLCLDETPTASPTSSSAPTPTKTPTPEQISTIQPTIISDEKESSPSLFITQSDFLPFQKNFKPAETDNNVLGAKSNSAKKPIFHIKALSLTSFFISLLNILYILNKIRKINRF